MKDYKKLKALGLVKIIKIGDGKVIQQQQWDKDTGPAAPLLIPIDDAELDKEEADNNAQCVILQERNAEIALIRADAKKVK